jgi:hypothetical protein
VIEFNVDAQAFLDGFARLEAEFPAAVDAFMSAEAEAGVRDLGATSTFNNRTYALRDAFSQSGDASERRIFIDPSAAPRRGKTPPVVYGAYLNDGTTKIAARRFMESTAAFIESNAPGIAEASLTAWISR